MPNTAQMLTHIKAGFKDGTPLTHFLLRKGLMLSVPKPEKKKKEETEAAEPKVDFKEGATTVMPNDSGGSPMYDMTGMPLFLTHCHIEKTNPKTLHAVGVELGKAMDRFILHGNKEQGILGMQTCNAGIQVIRDKSEHYYNNDLSLLSMRRELERDNYYEPFCCVIPAGARERFVAGLQSPRARIISLVESLAQAENTLTMFSVNASVIRLIVAEHLHIHKGTRAVLSMTPQIRKDAKGKFGIFTVKLV